MKLLKWLFPEPRTNLEVVLDKISSQKEVRNASIRMSSDGEKKLDVTKDLSFMIGKTSFNPVKIFKYFLVQFSTGDKECIIKLHGDNQPLFLFNDPDEVKQIRAAIISKYNETYN